MKRIKILVIISLIVSSWGNATSLHLAVPGLAESAIPEDVFVESIAPLVFRKFRLFVCNIVTGWNHANEQSDWGSLLLYLRHETCQLNKQLVNSSDDWGLQKIAESIDTDWAQSEKWIRYDNYFRYKIRYLIQEAYGRGLTLQYSDKWSKRHEDLYHTLVSSVDSLIAEIGILVAELKQSAEKKIPVIQTSLSETEWDRILRLQNQYWDYFAPVGKIVLPLYWPAVRGGTFATTPILDAAELLKTAGVNKSSSVIDLGAGRGDPCIIVGAVFSAKATGYEFHPASFEAGEEWVKYLEQDSIGLITQGQVRIVQEDYRKANLDQFTHLYIYPSSQLHCVQIDEWIFNKNVKLGTKLVIYAKSKYVEDNEPSLLFPRLIKDKKWQMRFIPELQSFIFERKKEILGIGDSNISKELSSSA